MGHCLCGDTGYIKISSGAYSERIPCSGCGHEAEIASLERGLESARAQWMEQIKSLQAERDALKEDLKACVEMLIQSKHEHLVVAGDCWFSCPASGECCVDHCGDICNCGADEINAKIDSVLARPTIRQLLKD